MILIKGNSGSGKSKFAEDYVCRIAGKGEKYYIATMTVFGEEGVKRVEKHRKQRSGKGFITIEQQKNMQEIMQKYDFSKSSVLLECLTNLVANEMFQKEEVVSGQLVVEKIYADMVELNQRAAHLFLVSGNQFEEKDDYDTETRNYIDTIYQLNNKLEKIADEVIEVTEGNPVWTK